MFLSLCLITKNENPYLKEWLDFHILSGVEHFWIYDNDSEIPIKKSIEEYIDKGWVTINSIHGKGMQLYAYDHCLQTYGKVSKWVGFVDTDEFIIPKNHDSIPEFLTEFESYGGLAISSLFFGSNGHNNKPHCGQIAGYLTRTPEDYSMNRLVKSIVQPEKVLYPTSPHTFMYREGSFCVNENQHRVDTQFFPCNIQKIQINHYFSRSASEWKEKITRGRGDVGNPYSDQRWVSIEKNSIVIDDTALKKALLKIDVSPNKLKTIEHFSDPISTELPELVSIAASKIQPVPFINREVQIVSKREELDLLIKDFLDGMEYMATKRFTEARLIFVRLMQKYPFDLYPYTNLSLACMGLCDYPAAWEALAQAWRISPRNWSVLLCMIDYFYAIGDFTQAEKCSLLTREFGNQTPVGTAILAISQWKMGKSAEASKTASSILPFITGDMAVENNYYKALLEIFKPKG